VAVLAGVAAVALGLDTGLLAQWSSGNDSSSFEQRLLERFHPRPPLTERGFSGNVTSTGSVTEPSLKESP